jgi:hypothetical protein
VTTVFFLTKLKEGADLAAYKRWVVEYDYPTCKRYFKSVKSYVDYEVDRNESPDSPYDFIEHIDMTSVEEYKRDLETREFQELLRQWSEFIDADSAEIVYTDPIL